MRLTLHCQQAATIYGGRKAKTCLNQAREGVCPEREVMVNEQGVDPLKATQGTGSWKPSLPNPVGRWARRYLPDSVRARSAIMGPLIFSRK